MPVISNFRTEMRPYSGYRDPSLPVGAWIANGALIGDLSGGFIQMNFLFQFGQQPLNSQLYNIERFSADISASLSLLGEIQTRQMDNLAPGRPVGVQRWIFDITGDNVNNASCKLDSFSGLPIWLGSCQEAFLECGVRFQFQNLDGLTHTVTVQGYVWDPRSVLAPGGPQRPPNGFLGS